jgi:hypothetical protein
MARASMLRGKHFKYVTENYHGWTKPIIKE